MDLLEIGKKWQKKREEAGTYKVVEDPEKQSFYILDMFPYPSGAGLHVWHPKWYIATDVIARKHMLLGEKVLHPMGFDTFWVGTEQYAIAHKMKPQKAAADNIATYKRQLAMFGCTYDRDREVNTADPNYFKWTQATFLKMYNSYFDEKDQKAYDISVLKDKIHNWEIKVPDTMTKDEFINSQRLCYMDYKPINRCPNCKTGLSNEDLEADWTCERCGSMVEQRPMKQRVIRITKYADRLLKWLESLPWWADSVKDQQRNWIGRSEWTEFDMELDWFDMNISVYTTRVDTVFGMSFVVMAPEHELVDRITTAEYRAAVDAYVDQAKHKTQLERTWLQKEKTWQFTWSYAINPFNGKKIPIYIWDYVLAWYGTWVVMAVPAHDERDYDFAVKYNIPIDFVIGNRFGKKPENLKLWDETVYEEKTNTTVQKWWIIAKQSWYGLVYDEKTKTVMMLDTGDENWRYKIPGWTIEQWETMLQWAIREVKEETWYTDFSFDAELYCAQMYYPCPDFYRENNAKYFLFKLHSDAQQEKHLDAGEKDYPVVKMSIEDLKQYVKSMPEWSEWVSSKAVLSALLDTLEKHIAWENIAYTEKWIVFNSWEFSGLTSDQAIAKMQEWLAERWIGWKKVNYRLQDRVFSRQRYWWEPIPMIHCPNCGIVSLTEDDLPLTLPDVENYEPTGTEEWPLANIHEWMNVKCPHCGADAKRESNTMPGWAWSSWYWIRYMDPHNDKQLVAPEKEKFWHPVNMYVWWAEHINRHMIYARFRNMFLYDMGITSVQEPFESYQSVWLIMAEDGRKMSKRRWNVVNPDDIVNEYGADTLRVYEMFMWPFDQAVSWNTNWVKWVKKFLDRVCNLYPKVDENYEDDKKILMTLHQTIKKVDEDVSRRFGFNTAIAQMMILVNELTWVEKISKKTFETLIILLAPFAPHLAEEFREQLGNQFSIFDGKHRPEVDEKYLVQDTITMAVQVNGKVRWTIEISKDATQDEVMEVVKNDEKISRNLTSEIKKVIYIPWKICNIVL